MYGVDTRMQAREQCLGTREKGWIKEESKRPKFKAWLSLINIGRLETPSPPISLS